MKIETATKKRIIRNALLSLLIYTLPLVLMFLTFYFTGQRPWGKKQSQTKENVKSVNSKNNLSNGSND